ncbi:hypothetical protein JW906_02705 [bacterium]|nr:hypothetical protein [bacterium]
MRKLAEGAGISIDRTHAVIHELMDKGYLIRSAKGMKRLKNRKKLFELWLANFGGRLRPKLILGTYKMAPSVVNRTGELLQQAFPDPAGDYAIGGGLAGYLLDHYYRGPTTEIFVKPEAANRVRSALKLIPARDADTTLFNLFSPGVIYRKEGVPWPVVHPMLIYAELLHQGGDRALDAAGRIDDACLKQVLDEE